MDRSPRTRVSTLIFIRWLALAGQVTTVLIAQLTTGRLPLAPVAAVICCSALLNLWIMLAPARSHRIEEGAAALHLAFDTLQLAALLYLTGGLSNPFALFLLAPVAVAAAILPALYSALLAFLAAGCLTVIAQWHLPLPWTNAGFSVPPLYLLSQWVALVVGIFSVGFFTWRMAEEARSISSAYSESQLALEGERRVAEVGALAAAVAHELNTPLATISLIARDLVTELAATPLREDMEMLISQVERCRDTLAHLTQRGAQDAAMDGERLSLPALVETIAAANPPPPQISYFFDHDSTAPPPWVSRNPALLLGLGNILQNAAGFARSRVEIATKWDEAGNWQVTIADDGPGFPEHLLGSLGEPYLSSREKDGEAHLGLGLFIATTLLVRIGGTVSFANAPEGGAEVVFTWERRNEG